MRIVAALVLIVLALPAFAQDADRDRRVDQAMTLVQLTTADSVVTPMLDAMWPSVEMQLGTVTPEVAARLKTTFSDEIRGALADVLDELAGLYADAFTLNELLAINKFYASEPGTKLMANQGMLMQQFLPTVTARLQETMPAAVQRVIEEANAPAN